MNMVLDDDSDSRQSDNYSVAGEDVDVYLNHYRIPLLASNNSSSRLRSRRNREQVKCNDEGKIISLFELAAQKVACHHSFGQVEHIIPTVPEPMQCRIAFWSFPQDEEDISLYTALANGKSDVYTRAEDLISLNCVCDMLQVGFHLSANVRDLQVLTNDMDYCRVAVTFDRRRVTSCSCSCPQQTLWCQHVVAVCLQRIRKPLEVTLRAPVSESLQRLEKNQLQKFAQYLINELPQQILPAAQKLLDELLSGEVAIINQNPAAPDPTAGATINEHTSWCLDDSHLSSSIRNFLLKQCTVQPTVCSDIQALHNEAPSAAAEYTNLLRAFRGREPESLWNLISIVSEMMKRRDSNVSLLLEIMTLEILKCDKIVTWWFETKVSLHSGSSIHCTSTKSNAQSTSQVISSSNLCDEIVHLWRLAAMDPSTTSSERKRLFDKFFQWHLEILQKHSSVQDAGLACNSKPGKRNILEIFPGFKPAMEGCLIDWSDWDDKRCKLIVPDEPEVVKGKSKSGKKKKKKSKSSKQCPNDPNPSTSTGGETQNGSGEFPVVESESPCESRNKENLEEKQQLIVDENSHHDDGPRSGPSMERMQREPLQPRDAENIVNNVAPIDPELQVYFMDQPPESPPIVQKQESIEDLIKVNLRKLNDPLEKLYSKAEGLWAHGHLDEARMLAYRVAIEIMNTTNYPSLKQLYTLPRRRKKKGSLDNQMSIVASEALNKIAFLCSVLAESPENYNLVFRLALYGVEMKRSPAATKPLEVKLVNQKHDLISLLKGIPLHDDELVLLRQRAQALRDGDYEPDCDALTTLIVGNFIFEAFILSKLPPSSVGTNRIESSRVTVGGPVAQPSPYQPEEHHIPPGEMMQQSAPHGCEQMRTLIVHGRVPQDSSLAFQAALHALGVRVNISENDHPLLCEGIRRQRGELALSLLAHYKDEQEKLDLILKHLLENDAILSHGAAETTEKPIKKAGPSRDPNQPKPTEASAYFMFELAKTVFDKAGGNSLQSHLFRPQVISQNGNSGIHRRLHMCMLRIALYALGLHNRAQTSWMSRNYNNRAQFINEQALEIGLPGIKFLSENWEGYLTPFEVASIADKAGCSNDAEMKKVAAEMAKSCLKFANHLDFNAVRRILAQCKEQSVEMIEEACGEIGIVAESDSVCADVLFATAHAWYNLYEDLTNCPQFDAAKSGHWHQSDWGAQSDSVSNVWPVPSTPNQQDRCPPVCHEPMPPMNWEVYGRVGPPVYSPYRHIEYAKAAYRVGIRALEALRPLNVTNKPDPKKADDIVWLFQLSKSFGRDSLQKFIQSAIKNITDLHVLHYICSDMIYYLRDLSLEHGDRIDLLLPLIDKCLEGLIKQTKDMKQLKEHEKQVTCILESARNLTEASNASFAADRFEDLLKVVESKLPKKGQKKDTKKETTKDFTDPWRRWLKDHRIFRLSECDCMKCRGFQHTVR